MQYDNIHVAQIVMRCVVTEQPNKWIKIAGKPTAVLMNVTVRVKNTQSLKKGTSEVQETLSNPDRKVKNSAHNWVSKYSCPCA
jgi:hypothetical protein